MSVITRRQHRRRGGQVERPGWLQASVKLGLGVGMFVALCLGVVVQPVLTAGAVVGVGLVAVIVRMGARVLRVALLMLFAGYVFGDRWFAYLGVRPLYVSEMGIVLGILTLALFPRLFIRRAARTNRLLALVTVAFVAWGAARTIPYIGQYGFVALRDAAVWGYLVYAFFVGFVLSPAEAKRLLPRIRVAFFPLLVWGLVAWALAHVGVAVAVSGAGAASLTTLKPGDVAVSLAGMACFVLLDVDRFGGLRRWSVPRHWLFWVLWLSNWLLYGARSRAAMLTALIGIALPALFVARTKVHRIGVLALVVFAVMVGFNLRLSIGGVYRVSARQYVENTLSVFDRGGRDGGNKWLATRTWRLRWWSKIVDYTMRGPFFVTGKGYGVNLATSDGFQVDPRTQRLRDPHNVFMTYLARGGVPGLALWVSLLVLIIGIIVSTARAPESAYHARGAYFLVIYIIAYLFNASFDVYLEGPPGGIPFWTVVGFSLVFVVRSATRRTVRAASRSLSRAAR